jgi:hypothetical protein
LLGLIRYFYHLCWNIDHYVLPLKCKDGKVGKQSMFREGLSDIFIIYAETLKNCMQSWKCERWKSWQSLFREGRSDISMMYAETIKHQGHAWNIENAKLVKLESWFMLKHRRNLCYLENAKMTKLESWKAKYILWGSIRYFYHLCWNIEVIYAKLKSQVYFVRFNLTF